MMHVAQIIDNLSFGGAQKMQITLAQAVEASDIDLTVISLRANKTYSTVPEALQSLGVKVIFYPHRGLFDPRCALHISGILRHSGCDLVHAHLTYANIIGTTAGRLAGIPAIASLRSAGIDQRFYHPVRHRLETWALRYGAKRVMAVGYSTAEAHQQRLQNKPIDVLPNAVSLGPPLSLEERNELRREVTGNPSRPLVISVGRLVEAKGYDDLLVAFNTLRQTHPQAAMVIAGKGSLHDRLQARISELNLDDHVKLLGPRGDVPHLLAASDIFVSSSHWEGLPNAVLEAMAARLPVIATRVGDVPYLVVDGTGLVVPPKTPEALASALRRLLDNPAQRQSLGQAAQRHVAREHSLETWANKLLTLYHSCLA